jgi:hypothetical protein
MVTVEDQRKARQTENESGLEIRGTGGRTERNPAKFADTLVKTLPPWEAQGRSMNARMLRRAADRPGDDAADLGAGPCCARQGRTAEHLVLLAVMSVDWSVD